jgi:hypothetical protein
VPASLALRHVPARFLVRPQLLARC